jgi:hypothetical protein
MLTCLRDIFLCLALCPCQMRSSTCWVRRTSCCSAGGSSACTRTRRMLGEAQACATGAGSTSTSSPSARKPWRSSPSTSTVRGLTTSTARGMTTRARTSPSGGQGGVVVTRRRSERWLPERATSTRALATLHQAQVMKLRTGTRASGRARTSRVALRHPRFLRHGT